MDMTMYTGTMQQIFVHATPASKLCIQTLSFYNLK